MPLPYNAARTRLQILSDAEGECLITTHLWHLRVPNVHLKWSLTITFNCVRCRSWTEPQPPCTYRGGQNRPRVKPEVGVASQAVKRMNLREETKTTEGSPRRCIGPTPGADLASG